MQTIPIDDDPDFRALEAHVNAQLTARGFALEQRKGSSSWIDRSAMPADAAVRFKLCFSLSGILFAAREDWAHSLAISLDKLGSVSDRVVRLSPALFRGDYVKNNAAGRRRITEILGLFTLEAKATSYAALCGSDGYWHLSPL